MPCMPTTMVLLQTEREPLDEFVAKYKLGVACEVVAEDADDIEQLIGLLIDAKQLVPAINVLACALAPREALWWVTRFLWDVSLDLERDVWATQAKAAAAMAQATKVQAPPKSLPPMPTPPTLPTDETKAAYKTAFGSVADLVKSTLASPANQAAMKADPGIEAHSQALSEGFAASFQDATSPPGPSIIPKPSNIGRQPSSKSPAVPKGTKLIDPASIEGRIKLRARAFRLRALACSLNWVHSPCQDAAMTAGIAATAITTGGASKALATATFWSGENLSLKPSGTSIPPTQVLRTKGLRSVLSKVLARKGGLMRKSDRLNWCLSLGLRSAQGKEHWDGSLELFGVWNAYRKSARSPITI